MKNESTLPQPTLPATERRHWLAFLIVAGLALFGAMFLADAFSRSRTLQSLGEDAATDGALKVALLNAALERPRALPLVLSGDSDLRVALKTRDTLDIARLNHRLESLIEGTQASVIYVVGPDGVAIAASNFRAPDSFVGSSYVFRDYFRYAMERSAAEQYALGTVSRRPGLYISRRVDDEAGKALGVVVAKVEFNRLESDWRIGERPVYVTDRRGIVLMTSIADWRFRSVAPISDAQRAAIAESLEFGGAPLDPLPVTRLQPLDGGGEMVRVNRGDPQNGLFIRLGLPVPGTDWTLAFLLPVEGALAAARWQGRVGVFAAFLPAFGIAAFVLRRRQRVRADMARERLAREELERRVEARTSDLTAAMDRLQHEIGEHEHTAKRLQGVQQDLVQANRLAIVGQVAAGVAHEINQPVATIRAFADNGRTFLERGRLAEACENLVQIAALTERIGTITADLKMLARKGRAGVGPIGLKDVIEGAVLLLRSRFSGHMDALHLSLPEPSLQVVGSRVRLEQILINLLQNALEATADQADARISVHSRLEDEDGVVLCVTDNGPGIAPEILEALFTPFNTSKENGLGLGLVISREIAADYGGRIEVESDTSGTTFSVYLRRAS